jgi:hypothetical protein
LRRKTTPSKAYVHELAILLNLTEAWHRDPAHVYSHSNESCSGNVVSNLNNRSPDLDQSIVVNQELNDRRPTRFQPFEKGTVVAFLLEARRSLVHGCSCSPFGKVLVFCDDDGIDAKRMIPDYGILGASQTGVIDVLG